MEIVASLPQTGSSLRFDMETWEHNDGLSAFVPVRPRLFGIAYRMLGSATAAEDIVQDVWLRWQTTDRSVVHNPPAFLATTTTRLATNLARSARSRYEADAGSWLPEPVDTSYAPHLGAERREALEFAARLLLEKLTPCERAAYILREAFDYPYDQISQILQRTETSVRQLVSRAGKHISNGRRASVSASERKRLLAAFINAAQNGELASLEELLATDAAASADGGTIRATRTPVLGTTSRWRSSSPTLPHTTGRGRHSRRWKQTRGPPFRLSGFRLLLQQVENRADGVPIASGDGHSEELVQRAQSADGLHFAPINTKNEPAV